MITNSVEGQDGQWEPIEHAIALRSEFDDAIENIIAATSHQPLDNNVVHAARIRLEKARHRWNEEIEAA